MRTFSTLMIAGTAVAALSAAQDSAQHLVVPFRDPAAPHKIEITLPMASVTVRGTQRSDVAIDYSLSNGVAVQRRGSQDPPPGMHRIGGANAFDVAQDNNTIRITGGFMGVRDATIEVPAQTSVTISSSVGGRVSIENVAGEIEVSNVNGQIVITNASGPVVAQSTNGNITASISKVAPDKNMSFSTFNGNIDLTLPADAKATLKGRADNGDIFTDFDVKLEPRTIQPSAAQPPQPPQPPPPPLPPDASQAERDRARAARDKARAQERANRAKERRVDGYVEGTINGGGPEIQFTTFNGRVLIHKK